MDSSVSPKDEIWFLRVCHHISNAVYSNNMKLREECTSLGFVLIVVKYFGWVLIFFFYNFKMF